MLSLLTILLCAKPSPDNPIEKGRAVLIRHECRRCHVIDDLPPVDRQLDCRGCHEQQAKHLAAVPDLTAIAKRVQPSYLRSFLEAPFDQRPMLDASMIRHRLTKDDISKVIGYFEAVAGILGDEPKTYSEKPSLSQIAQGRGLFSSRGCAGCHAFGNLALGVTRETLESKKAGSALAPNLRFTSERMRPSALMTYLDDPKKINPSSLMPATQFTPDEAAAVRDFLLFADPQLKPMPEPIARAPIKLFDRSVPWEEVKERVFSRACVQCHRNDHENDSGPGNHGGFGFSGAGLAMRTYEALINGAVDTRGRRLSVLVPRVGEAMPRLIEVLLNRRDEAQRDYLEFQSDVQLPPTPSHRVGMPLGLPGLTDEQLSLVVSWIAQGCVGPQFVSGAPGASDGSLVRDGPLAKNYGCEWRAPEQPRPSWALDQPRKPRKKEK